MSNELTVLQQNNFELATIDGNFADIISDEMEGLGQMPFETVKIPSGGALAFEIPGDSEDQPDTVKELVGIVVDHHAVNACWIEEYAGGNTPPDCSSGDGKTGTRSDGSTCDCATCPYNQFGSARVGSGKLCKNMHRIYILRSGDIMPMILTLPPTSITAWKNYVAKRIVLRGKRTWQSLTKISLKREKNNAGIAYSEAVFTKVADLSPAECEQIKPLIDGFKVMTRTLPAADTTTARNDAPSADVSADDFDVVPF